MATPLLLGTLKGVFGLGGGSKAPRLVGLQGQLVTHLAASAGGTAVAAVPVPGPLHQMYASHAANRAAPDSGLHLLRPRSGTAEGEGAAYAPAERVWAGDARSCGVWDSAGEAGGAPLLAVGTEPADVFCSPDGGTSWSAGTDSFAAAPSRAQWSFPAPPHKPHVLSLERTPQGQIVAGIEVGGVLVSSTSDAACSSASGGGNHGGGWEERNEGLYPDVHSCRIDPHNPSHWLAVTGTHAEAALCVALLFGGALQHCMACAGQVCLANC